MLSKSMRRNYEMTTSFHSRITSKIRSDVQKSVIISHAHILEQVTCLHYKSNQVTSSVNIFRLYFLVFFYFLSCLFEKRNQFNVKVCVFRLFRCLIEYTLIFVCFRFLVVS